MFVFVICDCKTKSYLSNNLTWSFAVLAKQFTTPTEAYYFMADDDKFPFDGIFELRIIKRK
jgi:hypothetical protein